MSTNKHSMPNVIIFGETGAGKSSVVNMLEGGGEAEVSDQAAGVTFKNTLFKKTIRGSEFRVFDTVALNEGPAGTMNARDAIESLYKLIHHLADGVHLLVYVMRAPQITATSQHNYDLFYNIFCQEKVPIVIVVTGLEEREDMDSWWAENEQAFDRLKLKFNGHACITATKGRRMRDGTFPYEEAYDQSRKTVEELLFRFRLHRPWRLESRSWFAAIATPFLNLLAQMFKLEPRGASKILFSALKGYAGYSDEEAHAELKKMQLSMATSN